MCLNIVVFQNGIICLSETLAIAPLDEFNIWKRGYVSMKEKLYVYMRCSHNRFILLGQGSHHQSLPPPKRATWDLVEEVENQVALNFCHSHTDLDAGLEGKDKVWKIASLSSVATHIGRDGARHPSLPPGHFGTQQQLSGLSLELVVRRIYAKT